MRMKKVVLTLIVATSPCLHAQEPKKASPARPEATQSNPPAKADQAARGDDEKAVKVLLDAFTRAFDAGDAPAAAATYTETAIVVDEHGERTEGRAAILAQYAASSADHPGAKIAI